MVIVLDSKIRVSLKYCGSCNPLIDLCKIGHELKEAIGKENGLKLVPPESDNIDTIIILFGCPSACGNKEKIRAKATGSIIVLAGETIDMVPVTEKDMSLAVTRKLKSPRDSTPED